MAGRGRAAGPVSDACGVGEGAASDVFHASVFALMAPRAARAAFCPYAGNEHRRGMATHASGDDHARGDPRSREERDTMPFMPFAILGLWFRGLLALGLLGGGIWLLATWYDALPRVAPIVQTEPDGRAGHRHEGDHVRAGQRAVSRALRVALLWKMSQRC